RDALTHQSIPASYNPGSHHSLLSHLHRRQRIMTAEEPEEELLDVVSLSESSPPPAATTLSTSGNLCSSSSKSPKARSFDVSSLIGLHHTEESESEESEEPIKNKRSLSPTVSSGSILHPLFEAPAFLNFPPMSSPSSSHPPHSPYLPPAYPLTPYYSMPNSPWLHSNSCHRSALAAAADLI
ncbi:Hypothetical protein FKW44_016498, partial [Caligus rogercresseyi]